VRSRSRHGEQLSHHLAGGEIKLQQCEACDRVQYPPAEVCRQCLSDKLNWQTKSPSGRVIACVEVHRSYADDFAEGGPWWVASVSLGPGIVSYAHTLNHLAADTAVELVAIQDRLQDGVLGAVESLDQLPALQARFDK